MKTTDKILIGIVVVILLLVILAFVVTLTRPAETYLPADTPENVVHNYLLALQKEDYVRAYSYLSPELTYYPDSVEEFEREINQYSWRFRENQDVSLSVEGVRITGEQATVEVLESQFYGGGLFDTGQSIYVFEMDLRLVDGQWKITGGDAYFVWCWSTTNNYDGCK